MLVSTTRQLPIIESGIITEKHVKGLLIWIEDKECTQYTPYHFKRYLDESSRLWKGDFAGVTEVNRDNEVPYLPYVVSVNERERFYNNDLVLDKFENKILKTYDINRQNKRYVKIFLTPENFSPTNLLDFNDCLIKYPVKVPLTEIGYFKLSNPNDPECSPSEWITDGRCRMTDKNNIVLISR